MTQRRKPLKRSPLKRLTFDEMKAKGLVMKASELKPKQKPIRKRAKNNTGWYNWAVEKVWNVRPHRCEVCHAPLGDEERPAPIVFSHLLPRSTYRKYKCDQRNVVLKCAYCHTLWHDRGPTILAMETGWRNTCTLYFALRDEANGLTDHTPDASLQ